jgi:CRP-like cAMP-binding protein
MIDAVAILMDSPLNQVLSPADTEELVRLGATRAVNRGQHLFKNGEPGRALFIVLQGSLDVVVGEDEARPLVVASVGPGQIVGELEVMAQCPRVASLVATEESFLLEFPAERLEQLLRLNRPAANKLVNTVARTLAFRLAAVNERLTAPKAGAPPVAVAAAAGEPALTVDDDDLGVLDRLWGP